MHCIGRTIILLISSLLIATIATAQVTIKATLDSAYLLMGKQTGLKIEIVEDKNTQGHIVGVDNGNPMLTEKVEIINLLNADTTDLGSNREEIKREIIIQSFDSGLYTLPPLKFAVGKDTFLSNKLVLKVLPVPVDTLKSIHDYAPISNPDTKLWDYLPDFIADYWWIFIIAMFIIAGCVIIYMLFIRKDRKITLLPQKKPIPPYELALQQLSRLKDEKLCERGQEKEYYTRLTEILRVYLDRRFGINAMEMTSSQIISTLHKRPETKESNRHMRQILEIADFVKFAKVRPLPDDNVRSFSLAMQFVEETKPEEPVSDDDSSTTDSTNIQETTEK